MRVRVSTPSKAGGVSTGKVNGTVWITACRVSMAGCTTSKTRTVVPGLVHTYLCAQDARGVSPLPADPHAPDAGHEIEPAAVYVGAVVGRRWACGGGVPASMERTVDDVHAPSGAVCELLWVEEEEGGGGEDGEGG